MSSPQPLCAFLAGVGISLSTNTLFVLNDSVLGVSGLLHRSVRGDGEAAAGVLGLILSGVLASVIQPNTSLSPAPVLFLPATSHVQATLAGLFVGAGSRMAGGCTSGHMIAGLSRFSRRSLVATILFFVTGFGIVHLVHHDHLSPTAIPDWSLGTHAVYIPALIAPLAALFAIAPAFQSAPLHAPTKFEFLSLSQSTFRRLACLLSSLSFGTALVLGGMTDPRTVLGFLVMPPAGAFNPSLAFLAVGALPLSAVLYHWARSRRPWFGQARAPGATRGVDASLVGGALLFGVGWGICGLCPGPALVNLGRALYVYAAGGTNALTDAGVSVTLSVSWLLAMLLGGFIVG